jgi:hypothetical protein
VVWAAEKLSRYPNFIKFIFADFNIIGMDLLAILNIERISNE